jgi:16S rRNA (guanine966-N2)-methyltransferase
VFSRLEAQDLLEDAHVLDMFAGSGALGIEAISRGAASATMVESDRGAVETLRKNLRAFRIPADQGILEAMPVERFVKNPAARQFSVVFADPPYGYPNESLRESFEKLSNSGWLANPFRIILERATRDGVPQWPVSWLESGLMVDHRRYGDTTKWYARTDQV